MSEVQRFWCHEARNIRCVRESDFDAQRLRADTAEADLLRTSDALIAAEQRMAELVAAGHEMLRIAAIANQGSNAYSRAIVNLHAALSQKSEGESQ